MCLKHFATPAPAERAWPAPGHRRRVLPPLATPRRHLGGARAFETIRPVPAKECHEASAETWPTPVGAGGRDQRAGRGRRGVVVAGAGPGGDDVGGCGG